MENLNWNLPVRGSEPGGEQPSTDRNSEKPFTISTCQ
jgi:hypothetical protein